MTKGWSTLFVHKVIRGNIPKGFKTIAATTCPFTETITPEQHIKPSLEEDPIPEATFEEDPVPPQEPTHESEGHAENNAEEPTHEAEAMLRTMQIQLTTILGPS